MIDPVPCVVGGVDMKYLGVHYGHPTDRLTAFYSYSTNPYDFTWNWLFWHDYNEAQDCMLWSSEALEIQQWSQPYLPACQDNGASALVSAA